MNETPAEKAEARAIRRRWITVGEIVAIAGVVIAGLTFWNSWEERRDATAERTAAQAAEKVKASSSRHRVTLLTSSADKSGIEFKAQDGCSLQSTEINFPTALGLSAKSTVVTHRIESDWLSGPMLKATDKGPDRREGKLPILIAATCTADDGDRTERAIYDLLWRTEPGGMLSGRQFRLRGFIRRESVSGDGQRRLDSLWTRP